MNKERDLAFMRLALAEAQKAAALGEVPVGAVLVRGNEVVAAGHNLRETQGNALFHAEMIAIHHGCEALKSWRLLDCELFVTLEPCPMCSGAIINSRIKRVIYGTKDEKAGCCGSVANLFAMDFNHRPALTGGILEQECATLLKTFFTTLRPVATAGCHRRLPPDGYNPPI